MRKIKIDHFSSKKFKFWAKKRRKNGFFGVFRQYFRKTLRTFAVLLQLSSNLQGSRLFDCRRCANNKKRPLFQKQTKLLAKKPRNNVFFKFFRYYLRKTLRKFAVMLRLNLNLQGSRPFNCKMCAKKKMATFLKKNKFLSKKLRKTCFFEVFRYYFRKTLGKIAVLLRLSSNLQGSRLFDYKSCANIKNGHFMIKKLNFWPKNLEKTCFLGFYDINSGKRFANLLYCSD